MLTYGREVSVEELAKVKTPEATATWHPIPHSRFLDLVWSTLTRSGIKIKSEQYGLSHEGARFFGLLKLAGDKPDYSTMIGLRNADDKSFRTSLAAGRDVTVCSNLSFSGEVQITRKHTTHILRDLPGLVEQAVGQLGAMRLSEDRRIEAYKGREMSDAQAHDLLIQSLDARVTTPTRIPSILTEWRSPRHAEFKGRTAWSLFNAFTEVMKDVNPFALPKATMALHGLMDAACGLTAASAGN
jgi:hypothetical protein